MAPRGAGREPRNIAAVLKKGLWVGPGLGYVISYMVQLLARISSTIQHPQLEQCDEGASSPRVGRPAPRGAALCTAAVLGRTASRKRRH